MLVICLNFFDLMYKHYFVASTCFILISFVFPFHLPSFYTLLSSTRLVMLPVIQGLSTINPPFCIQSSTAFVVTQLTSI